MGVVSLSRFMTLSVVDLHLVDSQPVQVDVIILLLVSPQFIGRHIWGSGIGGSWSSVVKMFLWVSFWCNSYLISIISKGFGLFRNNLRDLYLPVPHIVQFPLIIRKSWVLFR